MIGWNGLNEIAEYLDQRELYIGAHIMIRRDRDEVEGERSEPSTYLAMALSAPRSIRSWSSGPWRLTEYLAI